MPFDSAEARAGSLLSVHLSKVVLELLHRLSSFGATPPPSASGMKSQSMLPDESSRNIKLGFTMEAPDLASGEGAMSVNAALAVFIASPIATINAALARIGFFG